MVSNAKLDLPEPESPVITTNLSRGIRNETFCNVCSRAPLITISRSMYSQSFVVVLVATVFVVRFGAGAFDGVGAWLPYR